MLGYKRPRELWTKGAGRQRTGEMSSRELGVFSGHLWARSKSGEKRWQLGASVGHSELQLLASCPPG